MSRKIKLTKGNYLYNGKLYKKGDFLPDNKETQKLIKGELAILIEDSEGPINYETLNVNNLREIAKAHNIEVPEKTKKEEIIALLRTADVPGYI